MLLSLLISIWLYEGRQDSQNILVILLLTEVCVNLNIDGERPYKCGKKLYNRLIAKQAGRLWNPKFLAGFETSPQFSDILWIHPFNGNNFTKFCPILLGTIILKSENKGARMTPAIGIDFGFWCRTFCSCEKAFST